MKKSELARYIVSKFVEKDKIIWPRDIKIANYLIKRIPDEKFWQLLGEKKFPAMVCLRTKKSVEYLEYLSKISKLVFEEKQEIVFEKEKVSEDVIFPQKTTTLKSFIYD